MEGNLVLNINTIYNEAQKEAEQKKEINIIACLKKKLEEKIDGDINMLLLLKAKSIGNSDYSNYCFCATSIGLIFTLLSIVGAIAIAMKSNYFLLVIICMFYIIIVTVYAGWAYKNVAKNREILLVLEQIEKELDRKYGI